MPYSAMIASDAYNLQARVDHAQGAAQDAAALRTAIAGL
jgi:hypothetical protein